MGPSGLSCRGCVAQAHAREAGGEGWGVRLGVGRVGGAGNSGCHSSRSSILRPPWVWQRGLLGQQVLAGEA